MRSSVGERCMVIILCKFPRAANAEPEMVC